MLRNKPARPFTADDITNIDLHDSAGNVVKNITISKAALETKVIFSEGDAFVLNQETNKYEATPYYMHIDPTI